MNVKTSPGATTLALIIVVALGLAGLGLSLSELRLPLGPHELVALAVYGLAVAGLICLLALVASLVGGLRAQQTALTQSLETQSRQLRAAEAAQLMERFVHQAEALLDKESLDPNKRSVLRCLAVDAMRGNTGRGDPNISRLGRLFEWLAGEAEQASGDSARLGLIDPVLRQYAEIAEQLCQVGECDAERMAVFLRHQPRRPTTSSDEPAD
ncbi:hypothetical protein SAMN05192555_10471 [Franzmannia pantelleriensis]|uniref:Uncharacterized protein n=1 Tax=Franzmannia pantelleriensis TaxID=48727 RepID=A0A1G9JKR5_9GAMM|nr:hypothetical protein [Halomonas pantelleriensis]SDL38001.1 hypothetical protein SAMN05192555_10471 [Halomonas pantelleriensis]